MKPFLIKAILLSFAFYCCQSFSIAQHQPTHVIIDTDLHFTRCIPTFHEVEKQVQHTPKLTEAFFAQLSPEAKVSYALLHPESYLQICTRAHVSNTELHSHFSFGEGFTQSQRQLDALLNNAEIAKAYLLDCIQSKQYNNNKNTYSARLLDLIIRLQCFEAIPDLISHYEKTYNTKILTCLMLLMIENDYEPFLMSEIYHTLYKKNKRYHQSMLLQPKLRKLIFRLSNDFYESHR